MGSCDKQTTEAILDFYYDQVSRSTNHDIGRTEDASERLPAANTFAGRCVEMRLSVWTCTPLTLETRKLHRHVQQLPE